MAGETEGGLDGLVEAPQVCAARMVAAPDGTALPVPSGGIGGIATPGGEGYIRDDAEVQISLYGAGYYIVVDSTQPGNTEVDEIKHMAKEALEAVAEHAFESAIAAPAVLSIGAEVAGVLASLLTTSKLTTEVFVRGDYQGVPLKYCILL
ncbi:MAG: hypothetical protein JSS20_17465 [Proteobacteria bacterium]|nr:hypothetical protein [Pseudomonadota bacterium]